MVVKCCNFKEKDLEVPHQGGTVFEQRLHSSEGMGHRVPGSRTWKTFLNIIMWGKMWLLSGIYNVVLFLKKYADSGCLHLVQWGVDFLIPSLSGLFVIQWMWITGMHLLKNQKEDALKWSIESTQN